MSELINLAQYYHPHGFHREKGKYPGIGLYNKLKPLVETAVQNNSTVNLDLSEMKALYGSFVDGAFGIFIDDLKDDFFKTFVFSGGKPELMIVINRVFAKHKELKFNEGIEND